MLNESQIAFLEALALGELAAGLGIIADVLMAHDGGKRRSAGACRSLTSVPQIPATSIFISAASAGTSGIGVHRISVLLGPILTANALFL